jgi:hypothetical protein
MSGFSPCPPMNIHHGFGEKEKQLGISALWNEYSRTAIFLFE